MIQTSAEARNASSSESSTRSTKETLERFAVACNCFSRSKPMPQPDSRK